MTETKKEFSQRIANCNSCKNKYGETPFFFPMYSQKVMLVTGCPSFQAALKPLTSVRFFRVLCLALFGRANISEKAILEFHKGGNIYWTHYHKCYYENFFLDREYKNLPDTCYREHFIEELRLLSPQLVIVLGKHIVEKIFRTTLRDNEVRCFEKYGYKFYGTDFPVTGEEERFKEIRKYIQPYINFVKDVDVNSNEDDVPHFVDYERSKHSVHLDFELQALKKHGQNLGILKLDNQRADKIPKSIDELWHEKIILPNLDRYSFAVSCYAFIENQIKTFLFDIFSKQNNDGEVWYVIDRLRERREMNKLRGVNEITFEDVIEEIKWNWLKVLD
ncbi:MAG TPA: hypothetical protein GXX38_00290, partial [Clostridia bacterium]|nr:hypothetical protein [Clostridia bacterium]